MKVAAGTDAPFGGRDPWKAVKGAVDRSMPSGAVLGAHERLEPQRALALFLGEAAAPATRRRVRPGEPADLCVLRLPLAAALARPSADLVRATVIDGTVAYSRSQDS